MVIATVECDGKLTLQEITNMIEQRRIGNVFSNNITNTVELSQQLLNEANSLPEYIQTAMKNSSTNCSSAWASLSNATQLVRFSPIYSINVSKSVVAMDACGKPVPEILLANFQFKGGYDECMDIDTSMFSFGMQYSQLSIIFVVVANGVPLTIPIPISESVCIPDTCSLQDFNKTFTNINNEILSLPIKTKLLMYPAGLHVQSTQNPIPYSAGAIIMMIISCLFVIFVLIGTLYDLVLPYTQSFFGGKAMPTSINDMSVEKVTSEKGLLLGDNSAIKQRSRSKEFLHDFVQSFSLYKTVPAILSTSQPSSAITCINGMRVISMFWVILGHTFLFPILSQGYKDPLDLYQKVVLRFSAQPVANAYFSVDSFFFLSGLLVAYLTFREMGRKNGRFPFIPFYVHRFLRLTPTYMYALFFFWFLSVHIANGPGVLDALGTESNNYYLCKKYWWTNLLYINNFYPTNFGKQCMGWSWYLANDMQFYVISPLLLIPLFYSLPSGLIAIGITLLTSIGLTGFIAGYYRYPANGLYDVISGSEIVNSHIPGQSSEIYGKPYCRITPYLVGILLGYILYKKYEIPFSKGIKLLVYFVMWVAAIFTGIINVYGLYSSFNGHKFSAAENVMYFMFSRFTWGITLFLVVYACHNGYGGVVNRFLSMPVWIPLSRLTFNAYLVHEVILLILGGQYRDGMYYTNINIAIHIIVTVVFSFAAGGLLSVFVEFPLSNVERAVFKLFGNPLRQTGVVKQLQYNRI